GPQQVLDPRRTAMRAELKIIADAARYRIRRLEMANLGAAALLAWALHVPASDAALRLIFLLLLNLFVYLNNDWFDRREDIEAAGRDRPKTAFLAGHEREALRAQVGLAAALGLMGIVVGEGLL